jgi:hypothetical protein
MTSQKSLHSILFGTWAGYTFRSKLTHTPSGNLHVLQMKDLENHYTTVGTSLTCIHADTIPEKFLLQPGDVLFLAKGANNFALAYTPVFARVVPSSAFFILRPDLQQVDPGYLAWYLNQAPVQQYLKAHATGKHTQNITKDVLARIFVPVPLLARQQAIANIDHLCREEMRLLHAIQTRRTELVAHELLTVVSTPQDDEHCH